MDLTGYKLTFSDEFNSRSISKDGTNTKWSDIRPEFKYGDNADIGFGKSSFVDAASGYDPFKVQNGTLSITAVPDRTTSGFPGSWESGLIHTRGEFQQTYGYFEMRADLSESPGAWDAFWLLPITQVNPTPAGWQELDIVEHYGVFPQGTYTWIHTTEQHPNPNATLQVYSEHANQTQGFHTYGMDWNKDTISIYYDGQLMGTRQTPSDMHSPMFILANLAVEDRTYTTSDPKTMQIDYIRAYSKDAGATPVPPTTPTTPTPPTTPSPPTTATQTIGTGSDSLALKISQDAYLGNAKFTVSVDGRQVGGTLEANASHAAGQTGTFVFKGDWGVGQHDVKVTFLNDLYGGTAATDRNLHVDSATYNGANVTGDTFSLLGAGSKSFAVTDKTAPPATTTPTTPAKTQTVVGTGSDSLLLKVSEDAYLGHARFTVSVDGKQVGGVLEAAASHKAGQSGDFVFKGDWGVGPHDVKVTFLNDLHGGTAATDRNLHIDSATYNGAKVAAGTLDLKSQGSQTFSVTDQTAVGPTSTKTVGTGPDTLVLKVSEDAYLGHAQFKVSIDGKEVGGLLEASASHALGQSSAFAFKGDWGTGQHDVAITFVNDLHDGTKATDRNLFIDSATYNSADLSGDTFGLHQNGTQHVAFTDGAVVNSAAFADHLV